VDKIEINHQELPGDVQNYINTLELEVETLKEKLKLALFKKYGKSSEKDSSDQILLFEEVEEELSKDAEDEKVTVPSHIRKKTGKKKLDDSLPREEIIHDISEEDKKCECGCELIKIGEDTTEKFNIIPEQIYVEKHIYPKYACKNCEGSGDEDKSAVRRASTVPSIIPGSIVTPGLLAFILTNKFCDHLPFYRQEKRFERVGANISRQNMSNWTNKSYEQLLPLKKLFKQIVLEGPVIQMDETPIQVLNEEGKTPSSKSYMWLARGGPAGTPVILYEYHPNRRAEYVKEFLSGYEGYLQTDGYGGYDSALKNNEKVTHVGCLAHARRKFHEASKASKKAGSALEALKMIQGFYKIENELREKDLLPKEFLEQRKLAIKPVMEKFKKWLDKKAPLIRPGSETGKAVRYTISQWDKIIRYLELPYLTPDNNGSENAIRPFVLGRKNWLFSGSSNGAKASCFVYSLIETAKQNDLNPYGYLLHIFKEVPGIKNDSDWENLLPWNCNTKKVNKFSLPCS
jgi:transposase